MAESNHQTPDEALSSLLRRNVTALSVTERAVALRRAIRACEARLVSARGGSTRFHRYVGDNIARLAALKTELERLQNA